MALGAVEAAEQGFLVEEEAFFNENLEAWLPEHEGEIALIKGRKLLGFFGTVGDAFRAGVELIGYQEMAIVNVVRGEQPSDLAPKF